MKEAGVSRLFHLFSPIKDSLQKRSLKPVVAVRRTYKGGYNYAEEQKQMQQINGFMKVIEVIAAGVPGCTSEGFFYEIYDRENGFSAGWEHGIKVMPGERLTRVKFHDKLHNVANNLLFSGRDTYVQFLSRLTGLEEDVVRGLGKECSENIKAVIK